VFTTPLTARVTYRRLVSEWQESVCADNPMEHYGGERIGLPKADHPDFSLEGVRNANTDKRWGTCSLSRIRAGWPDRRVVTGRAR
jgi:hypothetical protein